MQTFQRKSLVQAFHLPLWGHVAPQMAPKWLVDRLASRELEINRLGGLTMNTSFGVQSCLAGDVVLLHADNSIGFEKPEVFERDFEAITADQLLRAA